MAVVSQFDVNEYQVRYKPTSTSSVSIRVLRTGEMVGDSLFHEPPEWAKKAVRIYLNRHKAGK